MVWMELTFNLYLLQDYHKHDSEVVYKWSYIYYIGMIYINYDFIYLLFTDYFISNMFPRVYN